MFSTCTASVLCCCTPERDPRARHQRSRAFAFYRTAGYGDLNWACVINELPWGAFKGSIDIEGYHDPVYRGELEMTGQVHGLHYLKWCHREDFVPSTAQKERA